MMKTKRCYSILVRPELSGMGGTFLCVFYIANAHTNTNRLTSLLPILPPWAIIKIMFR